MEYQRGVCSCSEGALVWKAAAKQGKRDAFWGLQPAKTDVFKTESFSPKIRNQTRNLRSPLLFNTVLEVLTSKMSKKKKSKNNFLLTVKK